MKKHSKVKTFRVDTKHERLLNECFEKLHINRDNFNAGMRTFIEKVLNNLKELTKLRHQTKDQHDEIEGLEKQLRKFKIEVPSKPQLPKSETVRQPLAMQKPNGSTKSTEQDDWVVCPDKDDWLRKSVECKKCGEDSFKKFSECYKERTKDPFSPIFKTSKPKPNL